MTDNPIPRPPYDPGAVNAVAAHPTDGNLVATVGEDGVVCVWDVRVESAGGGAGGAGGAPSKPRLRRAGDDVRRNMGRAFAVEWCSDGGSVAVGYESGEVCFLDVDASKRGLDTRGRRAREDPGRVTGRGEGWQGRKERK